MRSIILQTATRYLVPLMILFALFLLFNGHNNPGGGFVSGLVIAAAFSLYAIAFGVKATKETIRINPRYLIAFGLFLAVSSAFISFFLGDSFMTTQLVHIDLPILGEPTTPLLFDTGVDSVVIGVTLMIIFALAEETELEN